MFVLLFLNENKDFNLAFLEKTKIETKNITDISSKHPFVNSYSNLSKTNNNFAGCKILGRFFILQMFGDIKQRKLPSVVFFRF
jgi:hypothetical protein